MKGNPPNPPKMLTFKKHHTPNQAQTSRKGAKAVKPRGLGAEASRPHLPRHLPGAGLAASFPVSARSCQRPAPRGHPHTNPKSWRTTRARSHLRSGLTGRLRRETPPFLLGVGASHRPARPSTHPGVSHPPRGAGTPPSGHVALPAPALGRGRRPINHRPRGPPRYSQGACAGRSCTCGAGTLRRRH